MSKSHAHVPPFSKARRGSSVPGDQKPTLLPVPRRPPGPGAATLSSLLAASLTGSSRRIQLGSLHMPSWSLHRAFALCTLCLGPSAQAPFPRSH